jgi:hypothetical protein
MVLRDDSLCDVFILIVAHGFFDYLFGVLRWYLMI